MKRPGPEVCVCDAIKQTTPRSQSIASVGANSLLRLNKKIYIQVEGNGRLRRRKRKKKPISSPGARDRFVSFFFSPSSSSSSSYFAVFSFLTMEGTSYMEPLAARLLVNACTHTALLVRALA